MTASAYSGPIFDGDTHIQEKDFSFLPDYVPKALHADWLPWQGWGPDGEYSTWVGTERKRRMTHSEANPEGHVPPPGRLKEWLRAVKEGKSNVEGGWGPPTKDMLDPAERIRKLDEFGVESSIMFPGHFISTIGYYDEPKPGHAVMHAYNAWVKDAWTFDNQGRIFYTGILPLWDLDLAVAETDFLLKHGARAVVVPFGPGTFGKSPADPYYDPVWSRLNEAGTVVTFHVSEANFMHPLIHAFGEKPLQPRRTGQTAWQWMFTYSEIPVMMTLANYIYNNFFERYPRIRMGTVENGAEWLPRFLSKMDKMRGMTKNGYWPYGQLKQRPSTIFKEHCFAVAYPEDDVKKIVEEIGSADCILMGSDYPHAEGVPTPKDFFTEALTELSAADAEKIMYANGRRIFPKAA